MLAKTISDLAPLDSNLYLEPFFGSGAVFFYRKRWAGAEVINDLNGDVVNFFRVLRDKPKPLIDRLGLTLHARQEIEDSTHFIKSKKSSDVTKALYFFVRANQSFSANMRANGGWQLPGTNTKNKSRTWMGKINPDRLYKIADRLKTCSIENRPALYAMQLYDSEQSFYYLDPPYLSVASERDKSTSYQGYDMQENEHQDFINTVLGLKAKIIISGYDHPIYDALVKNGWKKISIEVNAASGNKKNKDIDTDRTEILWISPNVSGRAQLSLF